MSNSPILNKFNKFQDEVDSNMNCYLNNSKYNSARNSTYSQSNKNLVSIPFNCFDGNI